MTRRFKLAALAAACLLVPAGAADAKGKKPTKPSLTFKGWAFNSQFVKARDKTLDDAAACQAITGSGEPGTNLHFAFFVHAVKIPKSAQTTVSYTFGPRLNIFNQPPMTKPFAKSLVGKPYAIVNPPGSLKDIYWTGLTTAPPDGLSGFTISGDYTATVSAKVEGKTLTAKSTLHVAC